MINRLFKTCRLLLWACVLSLGFTSCAPGGELTCILFGYSCPSATESPGVVYYSPMPPKIGDSSGTKNSTERKPPPKVRGIFSNLEFGPTVNIISGEEEEYFNLTRKPGIGFHFYAGSYWPLSNNLSLHPAIGYKQARAFAQLDIEGEIPGYGFSRKDEFVFNSLSVPVVLDYQLKNSRTSFFGGPELIYMLGARHKQADNDPTSLKDYVVRMGTGVQAGVQHRFPLSGGSRSIGAQLKIDRRLSRLNSRSNPGFGSGPSYLTSFHLGLTYNLCNCY
jgi:hypothetical protein